MLPSKHKKTSSASQFRARVVYGFLKKKKVVILGEIISGDIKEGMHLHARLPHGTKVGNWEIIEILNMDFINGVENEDFIGLMLRCVSTIDFELLQSLRVYDEIVEID